MRCSSSSYQASKSAKFSSTYPSRPASAGLNPFAVRSPTLTITGSPGAVCAANGVFGKIIGLSGGVTCPSGSVWMVPAMSPTGTA
jgi:hypothetical protein